MYAQIKLNNKQVALTPIDKEDNTLTDAPYMLIDKYGLYLTNEIESIIYHALEDNITIGESISGITYDGIKYEIKFVNA